MKKQWLQITQTNQTDGSLNTYKCLDTDKNRSHYLTMFLTRKETTLIATGQNYVVTDICEIIQTTKKYIYKSLIK